MGGNLIVVSKENYGLMFFFVLFLRVYLERFMSLGWFSDEVYEMMMKEVRMEGVNDRLVLLKMVGYYYFILKVVLKFLSLFLSLFILCSCCSLLLVDVFI